MIFGAGPLIAKGLALLVEASLFTTVIAADPMLAIIALVYGAVSFKPLTNVVVNCVEFQTTFAPETNPVPFTVSVPASPPAMAEAGLRLVMAAEPAALLTVNVLAVDAPVSRFITVTGTVVALAILVASTEALSCVAPATVVASAVPFHLITAPVTYPAPFTVRVKVASPAFLELGLRLVMVGVLTAALTVKVLALEAPVSGFITVTWAVETLAIFVASIEALSCVGPATVVARAVPFHLITAPVTYPAPFTVRVKVASPACLEDGTRPLIVGVLMALAMVKVTGLE